MVVVVLLTACGRGGEQASPEPAPAPAPSSAAVEPAAAKRSAGAPSGPYDLVLTDVRATAYDGGDQVILTFTGQGRPGWAARYVDRAVVDGSGQVVDLAGDSILQLDVSGTPTRPHAEPVPTSPAGGAADLHVVGTFEGVTQVFVGITGGSTPFRVRALDSPARLVVDLGTT